MVFMVFLRAINMRSRLTILSNLNSVGHAIRKDKGAEFPVLRFVLHPSKKRHSVFFFFQEEQW